MPGIPKAVFDCMVFLQSLASPLGPSGRCFRICKSDAVRLVVSQKILLEFRSILERNSVRAKIPHVTDEMIREYFDGLREVAEISAEPRARFPYSRDPNDEPYLNLAIAEDASYLVSRDNDLLDLRNPANADGIRLRQEAPNLRIIDPLEFLAEFRSDQP